MAETERDHRLDVLERLDRFAPLRNAIREAAEQRGYWQGVPMPLDGETLVIEPSYPAAEAFINPQPAAVEEDAGYRARNSWWSDRLMSVVIVMDTPDGITYGRRPGIHSLAHQLKTLGCSDAWGIEQEGAAVKALAALIPHHAFKRYLLTGMFLETSRRSGLVYMFRKLRPTVVISPHHPRGESVILAALCLHPIAYYAGSWAGAMCPTDDVLAHLMLMRGDEAMFWRRSNQHAAIRPEAGL